MDYDLHADDLEWWGLAVGAPAALQSQLSLSRLCSQRGPSDLVVAALIAGRSQLRLATGGFAPSAPAEAQLRPGVGLVASCGWVQRRMAAGKNAGIIIAPQGAVRAGHEGGGGVLIAGVAPRIEETTTESYSGRGTDMDQEPAARPDTVAAAAAAAAAASRRTAFTTGATGSGLVTRLEGPYGPEGEVLPHRVCAELIQIARAEAASGLGGWDLSPDSIDSRPVVHVAIYDHGRVLHRRLYALLKPHLPHIKAELDRQFPGHTHRLDWLFLRKYDSDGVRRALRGHKDANLHTVNVVLNDNFGGGDLFFVPPTSRLGKLALGQIVDDDDFESIEGTSSGKRGEPAGRTTSNTSTATSTTSRQGSSSRSSADDVRLLDEGLRPERIVGESDIAFPPSIPGVGLVYDNSVLHGVTPVQRGQRFSLSLFFDEPDNIVSQFFEDERQREGQAPLPAVALYWLHDAENLLFLTGHGDDDDGVADDSPPPLLYLDQESLVEHGCVFLGLLDKATGLGVETTLGHWFGAVEEETGLVLHAWQVHTSAETRALTDQHGGWHVWDRSIE